MHVRLPLKLARSRVFLDVLFERERIRLSLNVSEVFCELWKLLLVYNSFLLGEVTANTTLGQCPCIHNIASVLVHFHRIAGVLNKCINMLWYLLIQHSEIKHFQQRVCTWQRINAIFSRIFLPSLFIVKFSKLLWVEIVISEEWTFGSVSTEVICVSSECSFKVMNKPAVADVDTSVNR